MKVGPLPNGVTIDFGDNPEPAKVDAVRAKILNDFPEYGQANPPAETSSPYGGTSTPTSITVPQAIGRATMATGRRIGEAGAEVLQGGSPGDVLSNLGQALSPMAPSVLGAGIANEALARYRDPSNLFPEESANANAQGQMMAGVASLAPVFVPRLLRVLSPGLRQTGRAIATLGARRAEQAGASLGQAGQLASQAPAGEAATGVAENIGGRLGTEAQDAFRTQESYQRNYLPQTIRQQRILARAEPQPIDPATNRLGPIQNPQTGTFMPSPNPLTEADYTATFNDLRRTHEALAQRAVDFERRVGTQLRGAGGVAVARRLATEPDVTNALLAAATPDEQAIIRHAIQMGQPLSALPYSAEQLTNLATVARSGRGLLGHMLGEGGFLGALGATFELGGGKAAGGLIAARAGLRAMDYLLSQPASARALAAFARAAPGTPAQFAATAAIQRSLPRMLGPASSPAR